MNLLVTPTTEPSPGSAAKVQPATDALQSLQCMEIWGGNEAIESGVAVPGLDAWVYARPHKGDARGGDIHYVSMCGSGRISRMAVADVAGHGEEVEALARSLRGLMRRHINTPDMTRFMRSLNEEFNGLGADGRFATAIVGTYLAPTDHLILCNAGHPRPLWFDASDNEWRFLDPAIPQRAETVPNLGLINSTLGVANLPLGVIEPTEFEQFAVRLDPGDLVVIYTDALIEARDAEGRILGEEGLRAAAASLHSVAGAKDLPLALVRAIETAQGSPMDDDVTVMALHHNGTDPGREQSKQALSVLAKMLGLMKV